MLWQRYDLRRNDDPQGVHQLRHPSVESSRLSLRVTQRAPYRLRGAKPEAERPDPHWRLTTCD